MQYACCPIAGQVPMRRRESRLCTVTQAIASSITRFVESILVRQRSVILAQARLPPPRPYSPFHMLWRSKLVTRETNKVLKRWANTGETVFSVSRWKYGNWKTYQCIYVLMQFTSQFATQPHTGGHNEAKHFERAQNKTSETDGLRSWPLCMCILVYLCLVVGLLDRIEYGLWSWCISWSRWQGGCYRRMLGWVRERAVGPSRAPTV